MQIFCGVDLVSSFTDAKYFYYLRQVAALIDVNPREVCCRGLDPLSAAEPRGLLPSFRGAPRSGHLEG
jgi:hypothetical protein